MMSVTSVGKSITQREVQRFGLKGKPKCPICDTPLVFVCGDVVGGHINQMCGNCGKKSLVDLMTMEAVPIKQESA